MDVKELVNSQIFYPTLWKRQSYFSPIKTPVVIPYNGEIDDLEYENPDILFADCEQTQEQEE